MYPGDDGSGNSISLPPSGESAPTDYVTIRSTNAGIHHAFSTSGNYYCAGNIVVTGTVTANSYNYTNGGPGTILNGSLININNITSGSAYRLGYVNVYAGTWIINSQLGAYVLSTTGTYIHATNCLSTSDGVVSGDCCTSVGSQVPYGVQSQTTMYYKALSTTTIYFNIVISISGGGGTISTVYGSNYLKAMRIA